MLQDFVTIGKTEWDAFLRDSDELIKKCEDFIQRIANLEQENKALSEKVKTLEAELLGTRQTLQSLRHFEQDNKTISDRLKSTETELAASKESLLSLRHVEQENKILSDRMKAAEAELVAAKETLLAVEQQIEPQLKRNSDLVRQLRARAHRVLSETETTSAE